MPSRTPGGKAARLNSCQFCGTTQCVSSESPHAFQPAAMIQRFYVHNLRSLENFELPVSGLSSALLIGKNGSGKSSVSFALWILQQIGRGRNRVDHLLAPRDISHGRTEVPVLLELEVEIW